MNSIFPHIASLAVNHSSKTKDNVLTQNKRFTQNELKFPHEIIKNSGIENKKNYNADRFD
jgi:hypothetical protein